MDIEYFVAIVLVVIGAIAWLAIRRYENRMYYVGTRKKAKSKRRK